MTRKKTFYLLAPSFVDSHMAKDLGIIPYIMQKHYGYHSVFACYRPSEAEEEPFPSMKWYSEPIETDFIDPSFPYRPEEAADTVFGRHAYECSRDMLRYIERKALSIDVLFVFGYYTFYFDAVARYKALNPNGKVYLKTDANLRWINNKSLNEPFIQFLKTCDLITSETLVDYLNQKWPVPVHYLPNGFYPIGVAGDTLARVVEFEEKEDYILTAGRLGTQQKATHILLEAFAKAAPHIPASWKLVLAGDIAESFLPVLEEFRRLNPSLSDRVITLGHVRDKQLLADWYRKSKIFALTSGLEGYANVLGEAKVHGCYLLSSDLESCRDAASSHEARREQMRGLPVPEELDLEYGALHPVGDVARLSQTMVEACNNQDLLRRVCLSTQQDAVDHFDWVQLCRRLDTLLKLT